MATLPTNPETNLTTTEQMSEITARNIEFVQLFKEGIQKLIEALGITRPNAQSANTVLTTYEAVGTLEGGDVPEGEVIPLTQYEMQERTYKVAKLRKWRKSTSAENIITKGYNNAVEKTTDKMRSQAQKEIKADLFSFLGKGRGRAHGSTLQAALAQAWGQLAIFFEDYAEVDPIYFINPIDIADYLATANITTQTLFGMTYVENFLGLGSVITNASVPAGTVIATAKQNIVCTYIPVNSGDLSEAFEFVTDELGYIGIHEKPDYDNMTASDTVVSGVDFFAEYIDGVIVAKIGNDDVAQPKYTEDELRQMTTAEIKAIATEKSYTINATKKDEVIAEFIQAQG